MKCVVYVHTWKLQDIKCPVVILRMIWDRVFHCIWGWVAASKALGMPISIPYSLGALGHSPPSTSLRLQGVHKQSHLPFYECTRDSELCSLYLGNKCLTQWAIFLTPLVLFGEDPAMQPWGTRYSLCGCEFLSGAPAHPCSSSAGITGIYQQSNFQFLLLFWDRVFFFFT